MNESFACCLASCATSTVSLVQMLERFDREAVRGTIDTGRYRCPYFTWGAGPPLLFLHGLADVARSFIPITP